MPLDEESARSVEEARTRLLDLEHEADRARVDFHHGLRRLHAAGGSMREIAKRFALSHQRVHQIVDAGGGRKGKATMLLEEIRDRVRDWTPFTRFTKDARAVVVHAQEEAAALGHGQIGTEHLLLGVLRVEEKTAAGVVGTLGVELEKVRAEVVHAVGTCTDRSPAGGSLPLTPRAKRVLEHSLREALDLGHNYIGTEHIILGLLREQSGLAVRVLRNLGAEAAHVRAETKRALSSG